MIPELLTPPHERVIVVTFNFDARPGHGSLVEDLVLALASQGHKAIVLSLETGAAGPHAIPSSNPLVDIRRVHAPSVTGRFPGIVRRLFTQIHALSHAVQLRGMTPTRVVYFSPAFLSLGPVLLLARGRRHRPVVVLVQWDFFPIHQHEIGRLPRLAPRGLLKLLERAAIGLADTVLVMSPRNEEFLHRYHPRLRAHVAVQPPWGGSASESLPDDGSEREERFVVVFGGQLTAGRGVEDLLRAAQILNRRDVPANILVIGDGPHRERLVRQAEGLALTNVSFVGRLPRNSYLELLRTASAGIAVTVGGVSIPSFPSKTVDYCRCGVPVIACTEETSDFGEVIESQAGGLACAAGDAPGLASAIERLYKEWLDGDIAVRRGSSRRFFLQNLTSEQAASRVLAARPTDRWKDQR